MNRDKYYSFIIFIFQINPHKIILNFSQQMTYGISVSSPAPSDKKFPVPKEPGKQNRYQFFTELSRCQKMRS